MTRFIDRKNVLELINKHPEFKLRKHNILTLSLAAIFLIVIFAILFFINYIITNTVYLPEKEVIPYTKLVFYTYYIGLSVLILAVATYLLVVKMVFLNHITEFQNMILSSLIKVNTKLFVVLNEEQKIVYADGQKDVAAAGIDIKTFDGLSSLGGFKKDDFAKIEQSLKSKKPVTVPYKSKNLKADVTLEFIDRPINYAVLVWR